MEKINRVIVYDGKCQFCTKFATWCNKKYPSFTIISVREASAKILLRERGIKFIDLQTIYFINEYNVFVRSKAIFEIFKTFNYPWRFIAFFEWFPVGITDFFYKLFSKYRYIFNK